MPRIAELLTFVVILVKIITVLIFFNLFSASGIDCFKCVSINGTNPSCEDPFHNNYTSDILERPCMGGRKGRNGLFPASACIKVSGTYGNHYFCYNFYVRAYTSTTNQSFS